jgi:hypothetical protein
MTITPRASAHVVVRVPTRAVRVLPPEAIPLASEVGHGEKGVRLAQNMQVGHAFRWGHSSQSA